MLRTSRHLAITGLLLITFITIGVAMADDDDPFPSVPLRKPEPSTAATTGTAATKGTAATSPDHSEVTNPATVHVIAYATAADGTAVGVLREMRVFVGPADPSRVRVGFFEEEVGGTGPMWHAAGWTSAMAASMLLDFHPTTSRVAFDVSGRIDGPSAGALMTCAVMAATLGHPIRPDATMTGTINPDGMIGPVGGISQKLEAAARFGKKLVLIPQGARYQLDSNLQERIDLVAKGRELGMEVRPVMDIWTAYSLLTGQELPRATSAPPPLMSPRFNQQMKQMTDEWFSRRYMTARKAYEALPQEYQTEYSQEFIDDAQKYLKYTDGLQAEGEYASAFADMSVAAVKMYTALEVARSLQTYGTTGLEGMIARIKDNDWLTQEANQASAAFQKFQPQTLDQLAVYLEAIEYLNQGLGFRAYANLHLSILPEDNEEERTKLAFRASALQILSWLYLKGSVELMEMAGEYGGHAIPDDAPIYWLAKYFLRATDANIAMLDEAVVKPIADAGRVSRTAAEGHLLLNDTDYAVLKLSRQQIMPNLTDVFGDGRQYDIGMLGTAMTMYARSSYLVATHYSLNIEKDDKGNIEAAGSERTMSEWLTQSEDQARRGIQQLVEMGVDPTICVQLYETAKVARGRGIEERLYAMGAYMRSNVVAQVIKRLGR